MFLFGAKKDQALSLHLWTLIYNIKKKMLLLLLAIVAQANEILTTADDWQTSQLCISQNCSVCFTHDGATEYEFNGTRANISKELIWGDCLQRFAQVPKPFVTANGCTLVEAWSMDNRVVECIAHQPQIEICFHNSLAMGAWDDGDPWGPMSRGTLVADRWFTHTCWFIEAAFAPEYFFFVQTPRGKSVYQIWDVIYE